MTLKNIKARNNLVKSNGLKALSGEIKAPHESGWVDRNLDKLIAQITKSARTQKSLPLSVTMSPVAYGKFIQMLKSKNAFFPKSYGPLEFLNVPIYVNVNLPPGTFTVESFSDTVQLMGRKR